MFEIILRFERNTVSMPFCHSASFLLDSKGCQNFKLILYFQSLQINTLFSFTSNVYAQAHYPEKLAPYVGKK